MTKLSSNTTINKDNTMERVCLGLTTTTASTISPNSTSANDRSSFNNNSNVTTTCKQLNMTLNLHKVGDSITTVADTLELSASSCLVPSYYYNEQQKQQNHLNGLDDADDEYYDEIPPAVSHFVSEDAYVLKCGSRFGADLISSSDEYNDDNDQQEDPQTQRRSIFGIIENKYLKPNESSGPTKPVTVSYYNASMGDSQPIETPDGCCCEWKGGDWTRKELKRPLGPSMLPPAQQEPLLQNQDDAVDVRVIDLTDIQSLKTCVSLDEGKTLHHFFRSLLICRHCSSGRNPSHVSSPWGQYYRTTCDNCDYKEDDDDGEACQNCIVALIMTYGQMTDDDDNDDNKALLGDEGIEELLRYRIGDGAPSWYLHSLARLRCQGGGMDTMKGYMERYTNGDARGDLEQYQQGWRLSSNAVDGSGREMDYILAVYRHLPPRMILDKEGPPVMDSSSVIPLGCLWETYKVDNDDEDDDDNPNNSNTTKPPPTILHRPISSPYLPLSLFSFLSDLITPSHLAALQREALTIPQWTAWPEKQHYDSNPDSWTVFPLCHTFPSTDVSKRVFIEQTTSFVPETTRILKETCGTALRTALFSRLGPRVTLMPHTGWADLANHVVRVHLPLIVPPGGNCGLWVDGCVEYQREGDIVIFDDSKVHRAFNYSDEERIVLILDLERPDGLVPLGGATGGHTEELDEFIKQLT